MNSVKKKKDKICSILNEQSEARVFEIISYVILKNHYKGIKIFIGESPDRLKQEYLNLYKTGRTNANDGGIDFVMRPLGRFFQVTETDDYNKYLLDMDKVLHYPITFVIKTLTSKENISKDFVKFVKSKFGGMKVIEDLYFHGLEEIITINELKHWLYELEANSIDELSIRL